MSDFVNQRPPEHHIHRDSEALPGARGSAPAADYSADVMNNEHVWQDNNQRQFGAGTDDRAVMGGAQHQSASAPGAQSGRNAYNEERPLNVQPTSEGRWRSSLHTYAAKPGTVGGVAIDSRDDVPMGKASFTDKLIGKTQKVSRPGMYPAASLTCCWSGRWQGHQESRDARERRAQGVWW